MSFQELFNCLDNDVYQKVIQIVLDLKILIKNNRDMLHDEFHKQWYDRVNEFHSLYQFNNRSTYMNYISPGRFFLGKLDRQLKTLDNNHFWTSIDGNHYTLPNKYWVGGRILKPTYTLCSSVIPLGFTLYLNSTDFQKMRNDIGKEHLNELVKFVRKEYPNIEQSKIYKKAFYIHYSQYGDNKENDL
jgi:hypothetical protein